MAPKFYAMSSIALGAISWLIILGEITLLLDDNFTIFGIRNSGYYTMKVKNKNMISKF